MHHEWHKGEYTISADPERLDMPAIYSFLSERSYWAQGRSFEIVQRSISHSLPFGLYKGDEQAGFCRVVTDYATFAWLADVFILEQYRGQGLGEWLVETVIAHPELQGLRRWALATRDAHGLYSKYGFRVLANPERWMTREPILIASS